MHVAKGVPLQCGCLARPVRASLGWDGLTSVTTASPPHRPVVYFDADSPGFLRSGGNKRVASDSSELCPDSQFAICPRAHHVPPDDGVVAVEIANHV